MARKILDLISSWWVNIHGHTHPKIAAAIQHQAQELEHVIFAGFTHEPAEMFADALLQEMQAPYAHVFFSDNGSTAVEVALKMAWQEKIAKAPDEKPIHVLAFEGGFHGDTWAAMTVGRSSGFFESIGPVLGDAVSFLPYPATWENDAEVEQKEQQALNALEQQLQERGSQIAALLIEPLVQGASGMRMVRPEWLTAVIQMTQQHGVRVIFDEVMTGFGRTGTLFAYQSLPAEVRPDIVCLSKGITGGFLPFSVTVTHSEMFDVFLGPSFQEALPHGHSYTANPIACAAALASLKLFQEEATLEKVAQQNQVHREFLPQLPQTSAHRFCGAIAACEMESQAEGYASQSSLQWRQRFVDAGLLIRPLGNTFYLMPPACLTAEQLTQAYVQVAEILS